MQIIEVFDITTTIFIIVSHVHMSNIQNINLQVEVAAQYTNRKLALARPPLLPYQFFGKIFKKSQKIKKWNFSSKI